MNHIGRKHDCGKVVHSREGRLEKSGKRLSNLKEGEE